MCLDFNNFKKGDKFLVESDSMGNFKKGDVVLLDQIGNGQNDGLGLFHSERFPKVKGILMDYEVMSLKID